MWVAITLLAITHCDLLPEYVWDTKDTDVLKDVFRKRAKDIFPAEVYLCSESKTHMDKIGAIKALAQDLWDHLDGRDPYIVGAANLGKSTLTDILISGFINKGEKLDHFTSNIATRRVKKLREARVTKSALPGTTLQNMRVPCFADHEQALWDTPGLLLDTSLAQFPIRNFPLLRAQRPGQIQPQIHVVPDGDRKSLALILCEPGDPTPLLRFEVRLKKDAEGDGPIRLVWNSTLPLDTKLVDIDEARADEVRRQNELQAIAQAEAAKSRESQVSKVERTPEEAAAYKEERRRIFEERVKREKEEMGIKRWNELQREKMREMEELKRSRQLARLEMVHEVVVERDVGVDVAIANFGWLGVKMPRTAMIRTSAPKTGVEVTNYDALALPKELGDYRKLSGDDEEALE